MTSLCLYRRSALDAGVPLGTARGAEERMAARRATTVRVLDRLRRDDAGAQFARFVVVGGISSALYAVVFVLCRGLGDQPANVIGAVLSSMLANELHRRLTFHAGEQVSWFTAQWEGGGLALVGVVTGAIGLVRLVALRWIFVPGARPRA